VIPIEPWSSTPGSEEGSSRNTGSNVEPLSSKHKKQITAIGFGKKKKRKCTAEIWAKLNSRLGREKGGETKKRGDGSNVGVENREVTLEQGRKREPSFYRRKGRQFVRRRDTICHGEENYQRLTAACQGGDEEN